MKMNSKAEQARSLFTKLMVGGMVLGFVMAFIGMMLSSGSIHPMTGSGILVTFSSMLVFGGLSLYAASRISESE